MLVFDGNVKCDGTARIAVNGETEVATKYKFNGESLDLITAWIRCHRLSWRIKLLISPPDVIYVYTEGVAQFDSFCKEMLDLSVYSQTEAEEIRKDYSDGQRIAKAYENPLSEES